MPCMQWDLFSVLVKEEEVVGVIAVSDTGRRTIMINEEACVFCIWQDKRKNPGMAAGQNSQHSCSEGCSKRRSAGVIGIMPQRVMRYRAIYRRWEVMDYGFYQ